MPFMHFEGIMPNRPPARRVWKSVIASLEDWSKLLRADLEKVSEDVGEWVRLQMLPVRDLLQLDNTPEFAVASVKKVLQAGLPLIVFGPGQENG